MALILLISLCVALVTAQSSFSPARPPSIPLAVRTPYLSSGYTPYTLHLAEALLTIFKPGKLPAEVGVMAAILQGSGLHSGSTTHLFGLLELLLMYLQRRGHRMDWLDSC